MDYNFKEIESRWQKRWAEQKTFKTENNSSKPKYYVLDMFPYPSGAGLHVGHPLGYIASDIIARYKRHKGFNVLHPMGYDSFGLPAEQYAIQTGQHPALTTETNIARYREQLDKIGFSFDWDREVRTSDPAYYKWTQWIFIQLFHSWYNNTSNKAEHIDGLIKEFENNGNTKVNAACSETKQFTAAEWKAFNEQQQQEILMNYRSTYLSEAWVNWCPALGTVLANDEVKDGVSERGGHPVERKLMKQWSMRISAYAQRLLDGLDHLEWTESLKESQRYWIGKSEGCSLRFKLQGHLSPSLSKGEGEEAGYHTTDSQMWNLLQDKALAMRKNPTPAENALWQYLRNNNTGSHFRRQQIIDRFIVDFVCLSKKLVVEADGDIHDYQQEEDNARTERLNELGYTVVRFRNEEILSDIDTVISEIKRELALKGKVLPSGEDLGGVVIEVFTTRPDTIFGVSFVTLAPEHDLVEKITTAEYKTKVEEYITFAKNRSERERQADVKKITGQFTGAYVIHPFSGKAIPVWIGDYVLAGYGTGAVMAVPAHDTRDYAFARHFSLPIPQVVEGGDIEKEAYDAKEGKLINSDFLNGLDVKAAIKRAIQEVEAKHLGKGKINFRLRDAVFGRQRYWGEPIPIYYKNGIPYTVEEKHLPLELPEVDKYLPTADGEPPLARAKDWTYSPLLGRGAGGEVLETTTMPGWAGSSWYFLRYMDPHNEKEFVSKQAADYWQNVDLYLGGSEHATGHLLYVRFWTMFLKDMGFVTFDEPAKKLINQGMIQGTSEKIIFTIAGTNSETTSPYLWYEEENKFVPTQISHSVRRAFYSAEISNLLYDTDKREINVDVNWVNNNTFNPIYFPEFFKRFPEYETAVFICKGGYYYKGTFYENPFGATGSREFKTKPEVEKMSKSKWNVVSPDKICDDFGADTLRLYEMFLGPLELSKPWNTNGITGVAGFLKKLWRLFHNNNTWSISEEAATKPELKALHRTIKKITEDIERFSFNTSVSNFMICVNELTEVKCNKRSVLEPLLIIISPYAPHIAEELWSLLGHKESIAYAPFPLFDESYLVESSFNYPISFNGKTRLNIELPLGLSNADIEKEVMSREEVQKHLNGGSPKKVIIVPNKIVNIVV